MWKRILATLFSFMLLAAACGDDDETTTTDPAAEADEDMADDDMADDDMADDDMADDDMADDDMADDDMADDDMADDDMADDDMADDDMADDDMADDDMADDDMADDDMADDDMADDDMADDAPLSPASITVADQSGDGTTVTIAAISLPAHGFIAVHADNGGSPGEVIGHSEVLPTGDSTDVVVTLDAALTEDQTLHPMAHIDVNGNGVYEFGGDESIDLPAQTADGDVAVASLAYTLG